MYACARACVRVDAHGDLANGEREQQHSRVAWIRGESWGYLEDNVSGVGAPGGQSTCVGGGIFVVREVQGVKTLGKLYIQWRHDYWSLERKKEQPELVRIAPRGIGVTRLPCVYA